MKRIIFGVLLVCAVAQAQQTIYWRKDHIYNGPGGKEVAVMTPTPSDQTAPSTPTGLNYSSVTATSVQLSWSAATDSGGSGLAGYKVYRQYGSNAALPVGTVGASTLSFLDQPLTPSTSYTWTVRAYDFAENHSSPSSGVTVSTSSASGDNIAPSTPLNVQGQSLVYNQVRLTWQASTDAGGSGLAGYKVYRGGTLISGSSPIAATTYTDTGLSANTAYSYTITAVDGNGNTSSPSSAVSVTTPLQLLYADNFNRPNSSTLGSPWSTWSFPGFFVNALKAQCGAQWGTFGQSMCMSFSNGSIDRVRLNFTSTNFNSWGGVLFWHSTDQYGNPVNAYAARLYPYNAYSAYLDLYYFSSLWPPSGTEITYVIVPPGPVRVDADGSTGGIKVYVNGALQIDYVDGQGSPRTGSVGIWAVNPGQVDDYSAYRLP